MKRRERKIEGRKKEWGEILFLVPIYVRAKYIF